MLTALPPPQILEISGADAIAFAHAQFSSDVRALPTSHWQWSSWLSAQGRVRAFFQLLRIDDACIRLLLRGGFSAELKTALAPFVFRSKVQLHAIEGLQLAGTDSAADVTAHLGRLPDATEIVRAKSIDGFTLPGPAASGLAARWLMLGETAAMSIESSAAAIEEWQAMDILAGLVSVDAGQSDQFLPTWLGLDRLGAISVGKGCYPGQEIVARLHFKGGNKRWLYRIEYTGDQIPGPGLVLASTADARISGPIVTAARTHGDHGVGLAVLPTIASGIELTAVDMPDVEFRVVSPAWEISA